MLGRGLDDLDEGVALVPERAGVDNPGGPDRVDANALVDMAGQAEQRLVTLDKVADGAAADVEPGVGERVERACRRLVGDKHAGPCGMGSTSILRPSSVA
jgi:hypothetical protein